MISSATRKPALWEASAVLTVDLRLLRRLRFSERVTGMHFDGPVVNSGVHKQLFLWPQKTTGLSDDLAVSGMDCTGVGSRGISMSSDGDYSESLFEPESILPSQFFEGRRKNEALEPVKRLMLAVLTDAVRCYQIGFDAKRTCRRRAFREAEGWLFSRTADGPFSFENVCCALDIAPDCLRNMLRKWQAQRVRGARVAVVRRSASDDLSETSDSGQPRQVSKRSYSRMIRPAVRGYIGSPQAPVDGLEEKRIMDLFAPSHLLLLLLIILVIFGPSKLGDVGSALGKGIRDFKRAINEPDNKFGEN